MSNIINIGRHFIERKADPSVEQTLSPDLTPSALGSCKMADFFHTKLDRCESVMAMSGSQLSSRLCAKIADPNNQWLWPIIFSSNTGCITIKRQRRTEEPAGRA